MKKYELLYCGRKSVLQPELVSLKHYCVSWLLRNKAAMVAVKLVFFLV